jgi:predicted GIY-YIG superfamily endonuclease
MKDGMSSLDLKWTDEKLKGITSKYTKLSTFTKENPQAYNVLRRKGREKFDEFTSHMQKLRTPFTDDELRKIALKYNNYTEFHNNEASAEQSARKRGKEFYNDITKHFVKLKRDPYTFDEIMNIVLKYDTIGELQRNNNSVYLIARTRGWINEVSKHMKSSKTFWTLDDVRKIAKQYYNKKEFKEGNPRAYNWSTVNLTDKEYDEITQHMEPLGNLDNRMIYVFEFSDNSAYVGLTLNYEKRFKQHMSSVKSPVNRHIIETTLIPTFKKVTDYINKEDAVITEGKTLEQYKKNGWKILNRKKTGDLGITTIKWSFDEVQKEALKYDRRVDFQRKSSGAYGSALRNGWINDVCKHMKRYVKK